MTEPLYTSQPSSPCPPSPFSQRLSAPRRLVSFLLPSAEYEGVRPIHIFGLRVVYALMFFVLGKETWTQILTHHLAWDPTRAIAWSVWTAFATLAGLGILRPLRMLPIILLEIFYKILWLILVAYPLWSRGSLAGSPAEETTFAFLWVLLPIIATPWSYALHQFVYAPPSRAVRTRATDQRHTTGDL